MAILFAVVTPAYAAEELTQDQLLALFVPEYTAEHNLPEDMGQWTEKQFFDMAEAFGHWKIERIKAQTRELTNQLIQRAERER